MEPYHVRLKRLRNATRPRLSQAKVAAAFKIKPSSVAQWESPGRGKPTIDKLPKLAALYRVSLAELCGDDIPYVDLSLASGDVLNKTDEPTEMKEQIALIGRLWVKLGRAERKALLNYIEALTGAKLA